MRIRMHDGTLIHVDCARLDTWRRLSCLEAAIRLQEALARFVPASRPEVGE